MEPNQNETITCPYCKKILDKKPKRSKACPYCKEQIFVREGMLYTSLDLEKLMDKESLEKFLLNRQKTQRDLKEYQESGVVKYLEILGVEENSCSYCKKMSGKKILVEKALENPSLVPPFAGCTGCYGFCRCITVPIVSHSLSPKRQSKSSSKGCITMLILIIIISILINTL